MIVELHELVKGELVNVLCPNGDRFLGRVEIPAGGPGDPIAHIAPPGCMFALSIRWPMQVDRPDIQPDPATLPTLAQLLAAS